MRCWHAIHFFLPLMLFSYTLMIKHWIGSEIKKKMMIKWSHPVCLCNECNVTRTSAALKAINTSDDVAILIILVFIYLVVVCTSLLSTNWSFEWKQVDCLCRCVRFFVLINHEFDISIDFNKPIMKIWWNQFTTAWFN